MKAAYKMKQTIKRLEKKYGKLNKEFDIEVFKINRRGGSFYDYCILTCSVLKSLHITVAHDGSYHIA